MSTGLFADFRSNFPGTKDGVFTNVAQRGLMPVQVRDAITAYLDRRTGVDWSKEESFDLVEGTRVTFAKMVNAHPDEIAFAKNVSDGLNMIAGGMRWQAGDNMVLCPELEHPANVYPWYNAARRYGIEVRAVPPDAGRVNLDTLMAAVDERTRLVSVSTVTFSPGFVTDVPALSAACAERNVRVVADAAQSIGILHTDVEQLGIDALAVATQKGLLSCYGMGFLYCRRKFAEELEPAALARFGVAFDEGAHETALTGGNFTYAPGCQALRRRQLQLPGDRGGESGPGPAEPARHPGYRYVRSRDGYTYGRGIPGGGAARLRRVTGAPSRQHRGPGREWGGPALHGRRPGPKHPSRRAHA